MTKKEELFDRLAPQLGVVLRAVSRESNQFTLDCPILLEYDNIIRVLSAMQELVETESEECKLIKRVEALGYTVSKEPR